MKNSSKKFTVIMASFIAVFGLMIFTHILLAATTETNYEDTAVPAVQTAIIPMPSPDQAAAAAPPSLTAIQKTYPSRLVIPSISVDANVQETGVTAKGTIGTPTNFTDVAWYMDGTIPGQAGSAIIDGHVDNGLGLAGVFKHLDSVAVGDDMYVQTKGGQSLHFVVTNISLYNYKSTPTDQILNEDDGTFLKLITCEGNWVASDKTYDTRLVVAAALEH